MIGEMSESGSESDQTKSDLINDVQQPKTEDEQVQNMNVSEIDPAILCARERVTIRYTKDELLEIAKSPASKSKPEFLDPNEVSASILDPEKWNLERKKSDTPEANNLKTTENGDNIRRRSGDPRERIRKENDGIVLSPQRRSFNSGCFVPANKEPLVGKGDAPPPHLMGVREIASSTRRIGSGRIIRDDWENGGKDGGEPEFGGFARGPTSRDGGERGMREDNSNKFGERRSFGREIDAKDKDSNRRNSRYNDNRRRYSEGRVEDEPEWFSSGPISQNDTIELRGFDESEKLGSKKKAMRDSKRAKEWMKKKESIIVEDKEKDGDSESAERAPAKQKEHEKEPKHGDQHQQKNHGEHSFDFDEFLKGENIPGLLPNGAGEETDSAKSRFSRWFQKESPNKESSRKSSIQEENHVIKDLLKDINESVPVTVRPPIDSNAYFAPISPAGHSLGGLDNLIRGDKNRSAAHSGQSINIMEMLAGNWKTPDQAQMLNNGKILSLGELEAQIRPPAEQNAQQKSTQKPDEEMTAAFKKLLQQASGHQASSQNNKPPGMSLLEMLNHSQQQDEARYAAAAQAAATHQQQHQLLNAMQGGQQIPNDVFLKLQHAERIHQKLIPSTGHMRSASPLLEMGAQQSRELLGRPEAQAILQGLKRGEITIQHLYQQLANPALQPRHREMLVTIIKLHGNSANYGPSPRVLSPVPLPPHHLYSPQLPSQQQQQQQLTVSPLPPNAYCVSPIMAATSPNHLAVPAMHQRIPSPRELQVHTQNILQRALIKKKLEEQTENFRKKQELQRGASPSLAGSQSTNKGVSSPTPLAFTPTSVLRKMTADKDEGKENKSITDNGIKPQGRPVTGMRQQPQVTSHQVNQQWQFPGVKQGEAGRPIVKANNYPSQTPDQFFAQLAAQQQRNYSSANRKPIIGQQYPTQGPQYTSSQPQYNPHPNPQSFSQPTAQQLRAQHQHRSSNSTSQPTNANQPAAVSQQQPGSFPANQNQTQQQGLAVWQQVLQSSLQTVPTPQQPSNTTRQASSTQPSGPLSPSTADQLTRWFSSDLLERARGGELPSTANLARLEEIERQAAPPVHN